MAARQIEESLEFSPQFDENGLIPVIAQDVKTGQVLMVAYMNQEALNLTIKTGYATYFSRSRKKLCVNPPEDLSSDKSLDPSLSSEG